MALKKSELYASLWKSCDELRGGMDASQYKDYILTLLFLKYISDRADESLLDLPPGTTFGEIAKLKNNKEIGDKLNKVVGKIADANESLLRGVIDVADFNDDNKLGKGQAKVDRLTKLVGIFEDLDFGSNTATGDDLLGDAYEYLMRHFATEAGKSKGQFYTPAEVSLILARILRLNEVVDGDTTVYDPTCGSGSLLLKAAHEAQSEISVYGQEMDNATWALARMNMILHAYETAELWNDNTLSDPHFMDGAQLKQFDFVVANPPFSVKSWTTGFDPANDLYRRFQDYGLPPEKNGDYAFLLHILKSLKPTGRAAVILPHGVLFRGNKEAEIRRKLVDRHLIAGIIGLPANVFYGTGIPACVIVLDKGDTATRRGIFMIDASRGFAKDGNKNRLRARDLHEIVDVFAEQREVNGYSRLVSFDEIANDDNAYNLNLPRYIDAGDPRDTQDLDAHLFGGIPDADLDALGAYWEAFPSLRGTIYEEGRPGYSQVRSGVTPAAAVRESVEVAALEARAVAAVGAWWERHASALRALTGETDARALIETLSEDLLAEFRGLPLVDPYAAYEAARAYWDEVMQDDVYLVMAAGWAGAARPRPPRQVGTKKDGKPQLETADVVVGTGQKAKKYKLDLIPADLVSTLRFQDDHDALLIAEAASEASTSELNEYVAEHGGDEGLLADVVGEDGKVKLADVKAYVKAMQGTEGCDEEIAAAERCIELLDAKAAAEKVMKGLRQSLDEAIIATLEDIDDAGALGLLVDHKWPDGVEEVLMAAFRSVIHALVARLEELDARYAAPAGELDARVDEASSRVEGHLRSMGYEI